MKKSFDGDIITLGDYMLFKLLILYFCAISIFAFVITVYDKKASRSRRKGKRKKWPRVPEKYLMFVGLIGGSLVMYITMKAIHHKTHHRRFMKGLPAILTAQFVLIMAALFVLV